MARIGLAKPYYAKYAESQGVVSYSSGGSLGKAVEANIELDDIDPVKLYADNAVAESVSQFSSGTLTLTLDELSITVAGAILGLTPTAVTSPAAGNVLEFSSAVVAPYVGIGLIVDKVTASTKSYMAVILNKAQFQVPAGDYVTQGETIEFQTPELTATLMKDDTNDGVWQVWAEFSTFAAAENYIKTKLSIT